MNIKPLSTGLMLWTVLKPVTAAPAAQQTAIPTSTKGQLVVIATVTPRVTFTASLVDDWRKYTDLSGSTVVSQSTIWRGGYIWDPASPNQLPSPLPTVDPHYQPTVRKLLQATVPMVVTSGESFAVAGSSNILSWPVNELTIHRDLGWPVLRLCHVSTFEPNQWRF